MNEWMDPFIAQCLADIPWGNYRRRTEKELRDHMEMLRRGMTEAEILQSMGDPARLRKEYYIAWQQTLQGQINLIVNSYLVIWGLILFFCGLLECLRLSEKPALLIGLYLIPFTLGAAFLRVCLRDDHRRTLRVTMVLLTEWVLVTMSFLFLYALLYDKPEELMDMICTAAPYLLLTFTGCLILGQLFGRKWERRRKLT